MSGMWIVAILTVLDDFSMECQLRVLLSLLVVRILVLYHVLVLQLSLALLADLLPQFVLQ